MLVTIEGITYELKVGKKEPTCLLCTGYSKNKHKSENLCSKLPNDCYRVPNGYWIKYKKRKRGYVC